MPSHHNEVVIVGGGICGLWLLATLRQSGRQAILLERDTLGGAQTLASQGMIHGGIKYALGGFTTPSSETIAAMPARWKDCIAGTGTLDLSGVDILSDDYFLFSDNRLSSKVTAFFGSRSLRGRVSPVDPANYPPLFANESFKGTVYRLEDIVVDTDALLGKLAQDNRGFIFRGEPIVTFTSTGDVETIRVGETLLSADRYIFAAGAGNAGLLQQAGVAMQRRPLKQVMVAHPSLPRTYAHAVAAGDGAKPRLTITTHHLKRGEPTWYLGGNIAETGVARTDAEQISFARRELAELFPWLSLENARWATLDIDRAEPAQADRGRPDSPHVGTVGNNSFVCWPTKLTLTPLVADELIRKLPPAAQRAPDLPDLPAAEVGVAPWDMAFP